jgi:hypothetical protein
VQLVDQLRDRGVRAPQLHQRQSQLVQRAADLDTGAPAQPLPQAGEIVLGDDELVMDVVVVPVRTRRRAGVRDVARPPVAVPSRWVVERAERVGVLLGHRHDPGGGGGQRGDAAREQGASGNGRSGVPAAHGDLPGLDAELTAK